MKKLLLIFFLSATIIFSNNNLEAQAPGITGTSGMCQGSSAVFSCDVTASSYTWTTTASTGISISNINSQSTTISVGYTVASFTITVTTSGSISYTKSVMVIPTPHFTDITTTNPGCAVTNGSVNATASNGMSFNYTWYNSFGANISDTNSATGLTAGVYSVHVTNGYYCSRDSVVTITNPSALSITNTPNLTVCNGDSVEIFANVTGGIPPYTYTWSGSGVTGFIGGSSTIAFVNTTSTSAFEPYSVNINDSGNCGPINSSFTITVNPSRNISGTVYSNITPITSGQMYLYSATGNMFSLVDTVSVNASGQYLFSSVPSGDYLVKCIPDSTIYPSLIGTYYGNAVQWDSALVINHDCLNDFIAGINLAELVQLSGPGVISGQVIEGAGFGARMIGQPNSIMTPGGPIKNVSVNLIKIPGGGVQGQAETDSSGAFVFTNVPVGGYTLQVDIPGLLMDSASLYFVQVLPNAFVSGANSIASSVYSNLDFMVDSTIIFGINAVGINEIKNKTESHQDVTVFPNPAKHSVTIKAKGFDTKDCEIELINARGEIVFIDKQNTAADYTLDLKKLNIVPGLYIVKLSSGSTIKTTKLIID